MAFWMWIYLASLVYWARFFWSTVTAEEHVWLLVLDVLVRIPVEATTVYKRKRAKHPLSINALILRYSHLGKLPTDNCRFPSDPIAVH